METKKQEALEDFKSRLLEDVFEAGDIVKTFERAGLSLRRAEPGDQDRRGRRTWLLFWEPPAYLRESFDLAPEVLLVLSPWNEAQARDVSSAEDALRRDHRLDRGVVIIVAKDGGAARRLAQPVQHTGRLYVFLSFDTVTSVSDPNRWFRTYFKIAWGLATFLQRGARCLVGISSVERTRLE